ncbi:Piso0_003535 [Millerozyma farinosa CBS 7064]|uniref:Piso0_003535 protein n=1 Tax=Pichia sorbitophila (strain ATCC MYA-4447 / BCRC 22081 / CBS 7064 / NBRC 10061 / NRRL Y-12695) TaxID=559304 RepID=G8YJC4_PICSO|nr:Piso0_003535 [Millerozyma farinosa CBS 7064]CCE81184.1 Piso0_003535 [Millerozyma farinosa CBS 7064]
MKILVTPLLPYLSTIHHHKASMDKVIPLFFVACVNNVSRNNQSGNVSVVSTDVDEFLSSMRELCSKYSRKFSHEQTNFNLDEEKLQKFLQYSGCDVYIHVKNRKIYIEQSQQLRKRLLNFTTEVIAKYSKTLLERLHGFDKHYENTQREGTEESSSSLSRSKGGKVSSEQHRALESQKESSFVAEDPGEQETPQDEAADDKADQHEEVSNEKNDESGSDSDSKESNKSDDKFEDTVEYMESKDKQVDKPANENATGAADDKGPQQEHSEASEAINSSPARTEDPTADYESLDIDKIKSSPQDTGDSFEARTLKKRSRSPSSSYQQHKRFQSIAINLVNNIQAHRFSSPFLQAVNTKDAPDYHEVIYEPKDLKSIMKALKSKTENPAYTSIQELKRDILLMLANCIMYNKSDSALVELTKSMKDDINNIFKLFEEAKSDT